MKYVLENDYHINIIEKIELYGYEGWRDEEYYYFIISSNNREAIHMEQAALAYFLVENGFSQTTYPITTNEGKWFVIHDEKPYMVVRLEKVQDRPIDSIGKRLAQFHQLGFSYQYEPKLISSYGLWKELWIQKVTVFEQKLVEEANTTKNAYHRLAMDVLPYIIGVSENAIQYLQESDSEMRFHEGDQGTISFNRFRANLQAPMIWMNDLVYDHPTRDIAEYLRFSFFQHEQAPENAVAFLRDYQTIQPLSMFSWRLLYARLIFPIHIYDFLEEGFRRKNYDERYPLFVHLVDKQSKYEKRLAQFFEALGIDAKAMRIPVLNWL
ncbi:MULTISPECIES: hypothetical protein [unclassified Virgibacillus]|uniref:hypothetical protein n=1 Tax=unclassified Virgibacillus TaxID=2620237 RepID=UPI0024DE591F|nr:hypothetical protein [Virgibacillus sp. LDC-1]